MLFKLYIVEKIFGKKADCREGGKPPTCGQYVVSYSVSLVAGKWFFHGKYFSLWLRKFLKKIMFQIYGRTLHQHHHPMHLMYNHTQRNLSSGFPQGLEIIHPFLLLLLLTITLQSNFD